MCDKNQCIYKWACRTFGKGWLPSAVGQGTYIYIPTSRKEWGKYGMVFNLCAPIYIVLVQTRTCEYVYIYTHIYIYRLPKAN